MGDQRKQGTLLIVDDQEDIRLLLADLLGARYRVLSAADGLEALEAIAAYEDQIDLVLSDFCMPRMDGLELLERIRSEHPSIGVIVFTAHGSISTAVEALKHGAYDYLVKPFSAGLEEIYAKCEGYFRMRDLQQQHKHLLREVLELSYFPRSNPHFVIRATPAAGEVVFHPGNEKTVEFLRRAAAEEACEEGRFHFSQGGIEQLFPPDFLEILHRIVGTDEVVEVERVQVGEKYYHHTYTPFVDNRKAIFISISDITPQVENEALRSMLEAGMEHEFKNHLMAITANAEMLHQEHLGVLAAAQKQAAEGILQAGSRLLGSLIERLEFSRAYSGALQLRQTQVDLYTLAARVYDGFAGIFPERTLKLENRPYNADTLPRGALAACDPQYIRRVLENLVGNALKHSPWVDVAIEKEAAQVRVQVRDGGEGMDEEDCRGIWSLGYRSKNRKGKSTGIGLPYSKLIVEAHGGEIGVRSGRGEGSTFYFTLPR